MSSRKIITLTGILTLFYFSQGRIFCRELTAEEAKKTLETTLQESHKKLAEFNNDYKKLGALAVTFVNKIQGVDVTEESWPEIANFIKELDANFSVTSKDQKVADRMLDAMNELKAFLKQGEASFATNGSKEHIEITPNDKKNNEKKFDIDDFLADAEEDFKLVSDAEELKFVTESMVSIVEQKTFAAEQTTKFVQFLTQTFNPIAIKYGVDSATKERLAKFYSKFNTTLPELKNLPPVTARTPEDDAREENTAPERTPNDTNNVKSEEPQSLAVNEPKLEPSIKNLLEEKITNIEKEASMPEQKAGEDLQEYIQDLKNHVKTLHENYQKVVKTL